MKENLRVRFIPKRDRTLFIRDPAVRTIVRLLNEAGTSFFIQDFDWGCSTVDDLTQQFGNLYELFSNKQSELSKLYTPLKRILQSQHRGNLKGAILEYYIYRLLLNSGKYTEKQVCISCFVKINDEKLRPSVDVAGWNEALGDCYSCKLCARTTAALTQDEVDVLLKIHKKTDGKIKVGVISFAYKNAIKRYLSENGVNWGDLPILGFDELRYLQHGSIRTGDDA